MRKVIIFYASYGGGHLSAARSIKENIEFYSNSVNKDLSKIIAEQLVKYHESNYTLTIKNRFGQSLSVSFLNSEDPDKYSLNINNKFLNEFTQKLNIKTNNTNNSSLLNNSIQKIIEYTDKSMINNVLPNKEKQEYYDGKRGIILCISIW